MKIDQIIKYLKGLESRESKKYLDSNDSEHLNNSCYIRNCVETLEDIKNSRKLQKEM